MTDAPPRNPVPDWSTLLTEKDARISALEAENAKLMAQRDEAAQFWREAVAQNGEALAIIERLRAENAKLREALHRIGLPLAQIVYCRDGHEEAVLLARAALAQEPRT